MYLCESYTYHRPELIDIGLRLMRRDPNDYPVKFFLVADMAASRSTADENQALMLAQSLIQQYPDKPSVYTALGGVYFDMWFFRKSRDTADKSIAAYQKFLQVTPQNDNSRQEVEMRITELQSG